MALQIGIVGLPNVGKSTLFNALTNAGADVASYPFTTIEPNRGVVPVPDSRLEALARMVGPDRVTPATVEFVDIAGLVKGAHRGEGLGNQFLGHIRTVDAIAVVSRCFSDPDIAHVEGHVDPVRDAEVLDLELILADLEVIERRLEKVQSAAKARPREYEEEAKALEELRDRLEKGERALSWGERGVLRSRLAKELQLLTAKKRIYVANVAEEDLPDGSVEAEEVKSLAEEEGASWVVLCAELEAELVEWPLDEAAEYRSEVGLVHSGLTRLAKAGYRVLDLITYFTIAGGEEVRAWSIERGATAPQAAGQVHSQMEAGFIRAEVIPFEQLLSVGDWQEARDRGIVRIKGRDYQIQDGDVCLFRFTPA
jgi:GTP-binding protein YchF